MPPMPPGPPPGPPPRPPIPPPGPPIRRRLHRPARRTRLPPGIRPRRIRPARPPFRKAAGLTICAAAPCLRTSPRRRARPRTARPIAAHHHEQHRVHLARRSRRRQGVARRADRESRGRLSCAATTSSDSSAALTPACRPGFSPCPACAACCPGAPAGVPTVPRNGAGVWRRSAGRAAAEAVAGAAAWPAGSAGFAVSTRDASASTKSCCALHDESTTTSLVTVAKPVRSAAIV